MPLRYEACKATSIIHDIHASRIHNKAKTDTWLCCNASWQEGKLHGIYTFRQCKERQIARVVFLHKMIAAPESLRPAPRLCWLDWSGIAWCVRPFLHPVSASRLRLRCCRVFPPFLVSKLALHEWYRLWDDFSWSWYCLKRCRSSILYWSCATLSTSLQCFLPHIVVEPLPHKARQWWNVHFFLSQLN